MQAHANDLRAEVANDWNTLVGDEHAAPDTDALDAFVHQAVDDWRHCDSTPAMRRLLEYADKLTRTPGECGESDVAELRAAGWPDRAIHDATQVIAYFNYINRIADGLGVVPEPDLPRWGKPCGG